MYHGNEYKQTLGKSEKRLMYCITVNILVMILYYYLVKCCHWGKLDKGYIESLYIFLTATCVSIQLSQNENSSKKSWNLMKSPRDAVKMEKSQKEGLGNLIIKD